MMGAGISNTGKAVGIDALLGVLRMFDCLRDPEQRKAVFGEFEQEHAKLEQAREKAEAYCAAKVDEASEATRQADMYVRERRAKGDEALTLAKSEADGIVANARALAEQKIAAVEAERTKVTGERALAVADREAADKAFAQTRDLADKAAADTAEAKRATAEAAKVKAQYEGKLAKLNAAIG